MTRPGTIVGRCAVCDLPVLSQVARRIVDAAATRDPKHPIRRLAHAGDCALELEHRIGGR